jgi:hypothetical protein
MKEAKYFRKGRTIRGPSGDITYSSINEAKRECRVLTASNGLGSVRVVDAMPAKAQAA